MRTLILAAILAAVAIPASCQTLQDSVRRDLDSLQAAVDQCYPLELFNRTAWRDTCNSARKRWHLEHGQRFSGDSWRTVEQWRDDLDRLLRTLGDRNCKTPSPADSYFPYAEPQPGKGLTFTRILDSLGVIAFHNFAGGDTLLSEFDRALDSLRDTRGLVLDLRDTGNGSLETAVRLASRFDGIKEPGIRVRTRTAGTDRYTDSAYVLDPLRQNRYAGAVVVNTNDLTRWPLRAFTVLMESRPRTKVTSCADMTAYAELRGLYPRAVPLPSGIVAMIPTAVALKWNGELLCDSVPIPGPGQFARVDRWVSAEESALWALWRLIPGHESEKYPPFLRSKNPNRW